MITKYQMISMLAEDTAGQMRIYAQRSDASACASLETWNEKMNCWVNRGAKGIALIDTDSERPRLKYVFDVSDVHKERRIGRDPYLWELNMWGSFPNCKDRHRGQCCKRFTRNLT